MKMMKSDQMKKGPERAPQRSLLKAMGYTDSQIEKPLVGIVNSFNEVIPGHIHLKNIARAVKDGVLAAGGTPMEFSTIGVCDGIAMGHEGMKYSLVTRELIADSVECMAKAHQFDALVFIPNCDKIVPGMLMAAARVNVPCIFVSGGPMRSECSDEGKAMDLNSVFEAVGAYKNGTISEERLHYFEENACPGCGSCSGMFTANSMNCLCEVLGMALPGNGTIPAVDAARIRLAKTAGEQVMKLWKMNLKPSDILTKEAFENALTVDMALGCSTNSVLHLAAIAHEAGVKFDLHKINEISEKTPNLCHLAPAGFHHMQDLKRAGGVTAVMGELNKENRLHTDVGTVCGCYLGEVIGKAHSLDHSVIRPIEEPYSKTGGLAILFGSLAPGGAVVKRSAVAKEMLVHKGPARVFESEEEAISVIYAGGKWYVFYHRQTNRHFFSRQACAEEIYFDGERFHQAEITSCGLNGGPLKGEGYYPAYIACNLFSREPQRIVGKPGEPCITQDGRDGDPVEGHITRISGGTTIGFKYFDCHAVKGIRIWYRGYCGGVFEVRTAWDGETLGEIPVQNVNVWTESSCEVAIPDGVQAIYFVYRGHGSPEGAGPDLKGFAFIC